MKNLLCLLVTLLFGLAAPPSPADVRALSLQDAYEKARAQSEALKISASDIRRAEAQYDEAISAVFPQAHFLATERVRDDSNGSGSNFNNSSSSGGQFIGQRNDRFQTAINVTQPLFSGFRDFLIADAAEFEISSQKHLLERQKDVLYQNTAELFYQALLYQRDLKELARTEKVLKERITELADFIRLGKSKDSEGLSAQAELSDTSVVKAQVEGLERATREALAFLTGVPSADLVLEDRSPQLKAEPLDFYLSIGQGRSDYKALEQRVLSAEKQVTAAARERWPNVSLEGNYYPVQSPDNGQSADILLRLDVPIFDGGKISARVAQQKAGFTSASLRKEELKRTIEKEVRIAHSNLAESRAENARLKTLVETARKSYESQRKDYSLGVVTNLDVLQSIKQLQDAKRRLLRSEIDARINMVRLLVAAGGIGG